MTSMLSTPGKYRSRKDWSTNSIPTLVALEEECMPVIPYNNNNNSDSDKRKMSAQQFTSSSPYLSTNVNNPPSLKNKQSRRSSLGLGLLSGLSNKNNKNNNKRRSSIAVVFLGAKKESKV